MEKLAKRIRSSNQQYFDAGVDAGTQKACDLLLVAAYECGFVRTPEKAKKLMETLTQLESEYGVAGRNPTKRLRESTMCCKRSAAGTSSHSLSGTS